MHDPLSARELNNADTTIYGALADAAALFPDEPAISFFGRESSYQTLVRSVEETAGALLEAGVKPGDAVTFMLPNCPQAVSVFYAISRIGAVANMIHTLSSEEEITYYLDKAKSRHLVTLDRFCEKAQNAAARSRLGATIIHTSVAEEMPLFMKLGYAVKTRKDPAQKIDPENAVSLKELRKRGAGRTLPDTVYDRSRTAVILYSGGSTGLPKGICLSDSNLNALGIQVADAAGFFVGPGGKFLSAMPLFHGFGLGVGIHTILRRGAECVLVPQFNLDSYVKTLLKEKTSMLAIVPSMLEAFLRTDAFDGKDLSFLQGVFSGADSTPVSLQERMNAFLRAHGCKEQVREGYGLTETVTACVLNPIGNVKVGSIGIPIGDTKARVVRPGTFEDLPAGENGELLLTGSVVMLGYLDEPEETAKTVRTDENGVRWLFTGDMCRMDEDGFLFFVQRLKRLIITGGYNVYPAQVERVVNEVPGVNVSCAVGVKDKLTGQRVVACVVPADGEDEAKLRAAVMAACRERLAAYAVPTKVVFMQSFPLTKMGKVNFARLEEEMNEKGEGKNA